MQYDIFLSYAHQDAEIAASIAKKFDEAGYRCFMAEKDISPAKEWNEEIYQVIVNCKVVLVLITPRSKESLWVAAEAGAAWALKKMLVPALMFVESGELIEIFSRWQSFSVETPTQVDRLIEIFPLRKEYNQCSETQLKQEKQENFNHPESWKSLVKIGKWDLDSKTKLIIGKGSFQYLLSRNLYGDKPFEIETSLSFEEYEHTTGGVNAGIILGWSETLSQSTYFNLLFTGSKILLEKTGDGAYSEHLSTGTDFKLMMNKQYRFSIRYHAQSLSVLVDGEKVYAINVKTPIYGNVGLRPWRSEIKCTHFLVQEN